MSMLVSQDLPGGGLVQPRAIEAPEDDAVVDAEVIEDDE